MDAVPVRPEPFDKLRTRYAQDERFMDAFPVRPERSEAKSKDATRRGRGFSGDPADHPPAPDPVRRSTMPAMSMAPWARAFSSTSKVDVWWPVGVLPPSRK